MDDFDVSPPAEAPKPTQKRSFFSKPATNVQEFSSEQDDGTDFFRQSSSCFTSIMHEQEKKKQRKMVRKLKEKAAQNQSDDDIDAPLESRKKRRISIEGSPESGSAGRLRSSVLQAKSRSSTPGPRNESEKLRHAVLSDTNGKPNVIDLGDSTPEPVVDDDDKDAAYTPPIQRKSPKKPLPPPVEVIEVTREDERHELDEDDEDAAMIAKLKERKRQRELDASMVSPSRGRSAHTRDIRQPPTQPDPPVSVFISSTIEGTKPLIVRIYLSKKIGELLKTWCTFNNLGEHQSAEVFLAWRRFKQWPTTTLRRMLEGKVDFEVSGDGAIVSKPGCKGDGLSDDFSKIHLVATTEDGLAQLKSVHQRAIHEPSHDLDAQDDLNETSAEAADMPAVKVDDNIPITLKEPKEFGELKIKVKRDTGIGRIITAFKKAKKIPEDRTVTLRFDGDELNPNDTMADTEIEDKDTVEVYVR